MAATINTVITAQDRTAKAFNSVSKRLGRMNKSIGESVTRVAKIGAAFAATGIAAGAALTKMSMANIDSLAKTADKIGVTTEALSGLRHAAEMTGVASSTMDMAMQRLTRRISEAADGTGEAKDAIIELGLNAELLEQMPLDQRMEHIADAMGRVENHSDKVRLSFKLFDSEGVAVVNTLSGGSKALKAYALEAEHLGLAVSRVDAAKIELANEAVTRAKSVFTGLGNQLATAFSPIIDGIATSFHQSALDTEGFGTIGQQVADALVAGFGNVLDLIQMVQHGMLAAKLVALEAKHAIQSVFEPDAAMKAYQLQLHDMTVALNKSKISQKEYKEWMIKAQKQMRDGTFMDNASVQSGADETQAAIDQIRAAMAKLTGTQLPSERVEIFYQRVMAASAAAAEEIKKNAPGQVILDNLKENKDEIVKQLTFLEKQEKEGQKRKTEFTAKTMTEQTSHVLGELSNQFSGIASNNKALFDMNKAFQIGNAIMQTYQAATLALASYPPPLSFAMAAASVASGLGQVAQIRAQSFEGGGFTGIGPRSGGVDGKGGFLSLLHPNESVIDHTKGQGQGITIVNNVDATGSGPEVDQKIKQAMIQTSNVTIGTIQDLMRRGRFA